MRFAMELDRFGPVTCIDLSRNQRHMVRLKDLNHLALTWSVRRAQQGARVYAVNIAVFLSYSVKYVHTPV